jgi:putative sterol carrier protein
LPKKEASVTEERLWLAQMIKGKTDEEILEFVHLLGGVEPILDLTFAAMPAELDPDRAQDAVIGWELTEGDRTFVFRVEIKNGTVTAERGEAADARITLAMSVPDFLRVLTEELGGAKAFLQGKLKIRGDPVFAYGVPAMFPFREKERVS